MIFIEYFNNLNFLFNFDLFFLNDIIVVFLSYNFIKSLIFSSVFELIWPTQFFNRRNNFNYNFLRFRSFTEYLVKLRLIRYKNRIINRFFRKFYLKF